MIKNKHRTIAIIVVLLFGVALFFVGTDGFSAYTAETARTNKLIEEKPTFPNARLEDSEEREYPISDFRGKYVLITFFYSSCTTVCFELEMNMAEVYNLLPSKFIGEDIIFLSISFDPERDFPERLNEYKDFFDSDGETWRMARINDELELKKLLTKFGVIVIPDDYGNFTHNSAFYLVDKKGILIDVMDYKKVDEAAQKITAILETEVEG